MRASHVLLLAAATFLPALAACGGKVVVDASPTGQGGAGGAGGTPGTTTGSSAMTGSIHPPSCEPFPSPIGSLFACGAGAGSGAGMPFACSTNRCDEEKNQYVAECVGTACECTYIPSDGTPSLGCSCTLESSCENNGYDCCPVHL